MSAQLTATVGTSGRHRTGLRGDPWLALASVALGVFMVGLDGSVVAIANPKIAADLHASLSDLQWITNAYLLALAALLIVGGKLGDRYGRRLVFLIGAAGFGVSSVAIGLAGTTEGVIAFRAVQGLFGALLMPNTLAILRAAFPPAKLNMAIGVWGGASGVSVALGPIVGGLLVEHVSWQSVFYINAPIAVLAVALGSVVIEESRSASAARSLDLAGIAVLTGALVLVIFGIVRAQEWGWSSEATLGCIASGIALLGVFAMIEMRTPEPLLPLRLFRNVSLTIGTAVVTINFFAMLGVLFFMTLYLESVQGRSPVDAGVHTLPLSLSLMLAAPMGGYLTQRFGPRMAMATGLLAVAAALGLLIRLQPDSPYMTLWPSFVLLGVGIGFVMTASSDAIVGNATTDDAGIAGGLQSTAIQLGGVLGTAVLGSVLSSKVGSVLTDKLLAAGTPAQVAAGLSGTKEYVAQGVAPRVPGVPDVVQQAVVTGSHEAFITGLHTSLEVGIAVALAGAALSLLVRRGENSGAGGIAVH